jgi:ATP:corrinoid adenosyltransferase
MAEMIPPRISNYVESKAEHMVFNSFRKDKRCSEWIIIHSLMLNEHHLRKYGEIDFLVIAPGKGLFVLEVKGGRVYKKKGVFYHTGRQGKVSESSKSAFVQVRENVHSLRQYISLYFANDSKLSDILIGQGVIFPQCTYATKGPEEVSWQTLDKTGFTKPISHFIDCLSREFIKKHPNNHVIDHDEAILLKDYLRGDVEVAISLKVISNEVEEDILRLTEEQYKCLDITEKNSRVLVEGAAGTGKTLLALESARRSINKNERVLLVCYNKMLSNWIKLNLKNEIEAGQIDTETFHGFMEQYVERTKDMIIDDDYFKIDLPVRFLEYLDNNKFRKYDTVIIDEAQDLIRHDYLAVINSLVEGGLKDGRFIFFGDFNHQAIFTDLSYDDLIQYLNRETAYTIYPLNKNCRNTREIAAATVMLNEFKQPPFELPEVRGKEVHYYFFNNKTDQKGALQNILMKYIKENIPPRKITLLSPIKYKSSIVSEVKILNHPIKEIDDVLLLYKNRKAITFSTIQAFKGMENTFIILTDLDDLSDEYTKKLTYIAMSRAKANLTLLIAKSQKNTYRERMLKYADG